MKTTYDVVVADSIEDLEIEVNRRLNTSVSGTVYKWQLQGGIAIMDGRYCQAMTLTE